MVRSFSVPSLVGHAPLVVSLGLFEVPLDLVSAHLMVFIFAFALVESASVVAEESATGDTIFVAVSEQLWVVVTALVAVPALVWALEEEPAYWSVNQFTCSLLLSVSVGLSSSPCLSASLSPFDIWLSFVRSSVLPDLVDGSAVTFFPGGL